MLRLTVTQSPQMATIATALNGLDQRVLLAASDGLRRGGDKLRTKVKDALVTQTGVKSKTAINKRVSSVSGRGSLVYVINGRGVPPISIPQEVEATAASTGAWKRYSPREHWRFQGRGGDGRFGAITNEPDAEVTSWPWRIVHNFIRSFKDPKLGMRQAIPSEGKKGWRRRKLFGPNVAKELVTGQSLATFEAGVTVLVVPEVQKALLRVHVWSYGA